MEAIYGNCEATYLHEFENWLGKVQKIQITQIELGLK